MMKSYALHSLVTALIFNRFGLPSLQVQENVIPLNQFVANPHKALENLTALAQAHEAKEIDGPFNRYVWGCEVSTTKAPRRQARVLSILRAIGVSVPEIEYANLF